MNAPDYMNDVFVYDNDILWEPLGGGLKRKIMSYDDHMMVVKVHFEKGGVGALHHHFHVQRSYVESGLFEIERNGIKKILKKGDVFYIPSNVVHGAVCLEEGILIDIFSPKREDFLK